MRCRTSTLRHSASGIVLDTPILIPSFSSKGFAYSKPDGKSEIAKILAASSEFITDTYLISAYDIHYEHLPRPADLVATPELMFLDSGGYEISTDRDYSSVIDPLPAPEPWTVEMWQEVVAQWPEEVPVVVVAYDHHCERNSYEEQVDRASARLACSGRHLRSLLLKPESTDQLTLRETLKHAVSDPGKLAAFDIVGVTEKELGNSMINRMAAVAKLRRAMDENGVDTPIHVFGSLDPISVCLYFVSGAEMFDGLTWIRYAFRNGQCIYTHNISPLEYGLHVRDNAVKSRTLASNCYALQSLERRLREFASTNDYDKLAPHAELVKDACDSLDTKLESKGVT